MAQVMKKLDRTDAELLGMETGTLRVIEGDVPGASIEMRIDALISATRTLIASTALSRGAVVDFDKRANKIEEALFVEIIPTLKFLKGELLASSKSRVALQASLAGGTCGAILAGVVFLVCYLLVLR